MALKPLPCQAALLASIKMVHDWRIYHCRITGGYCALSGIGPDIGILSLACMACKRPHPAAVPGEASPDR